MRSRTKEIMFSTMYSGAIIQRKGTLEHYKGILERGNFSAALNPNTVCFDITLDGIKQADCKFADLLKLSA